MTGQQPSLTALIVAHNEERHLAACLASVRFCDEVVVLLDRCTDGSAAIARAQADKVIQGAWPMEGERRMAGLAGCSGAWILEVDADERVPPALATEVRAAIAAGTADRHPIPFLYYIGARPIRHGWGANLGVGSVERLFRAGTKTWGDGAVHPVVSFTGTRGNRLSTPMDHYCDDDLADLMARFNTYTTQHALTLRDRGKDEGLTKQILRGPFRFYKCYVRREGWREGGIGFLIAVLAALYPLLAYLKAFRDTPRAD